MTWIGVVAAVALMAVVLIDAFEVVLLPRRVRHGFRLARLFYRTSWTRGTDGGAAAPARPAAHGTFLSAFGPLSLFVLIVLWAAGLIVGFALLHWSLGTRAVGGRTRLRRLTCTSAAPRSSRSATATWCPAARVGPGAERGRGRPRLRLPGRHRQLPAGALSGLFAARDHHRAARCPGRLAAHRRRTAAAAGRRPQPGRRRPVPGRVGALGGRTAGEPPLVSGAELLPLAARKPVVGRRR